MPDTASPFPLTLDDAQRIIARDALARLGRALESMSGGDLACHSAALSLAAHEAEQIVAKAAEQETQL